MGTGRELIARGVAVEEGGFRMPLAGRELQVLVPGRTLTDSAFRAIDRNVDTVLIMPKPDRAYRIVSRHDGALLAGTDGRTLRGKAAITEPTAFWRPSRYLILEEIPPDSEVWR